MSPRSISLRDTTMRMRVRSLVPMPCILAYRRSAKKPIFDLTHLTEKLFLSLIYGFLYDLIYSYVWKVIFTYAKEALLYATGELLLDGDLNVVAGYFFVLDEGLAELLVAARNQDSIELGLVSAPLLLTCCLRQRDLYSYPKCMRDSMTLCGWRFFFNIYI